MVVGVLCETSPGLRDSERGVAVFGLNGQTQYLRVEAYYLHEIGGRTYLPVTFIDEDVEKMLIELPYEADSGRWRMFVSKENVVQLKV